MTNFYSTIFVQTNTCSGEKIAVGLLAVTGSEIFFGYSACKLKIAAQLMDANTVEHAAFNLQLLEGNVKKANKALKTSLQLGAAAEFTIEKLQYLHKYSKGLMLFDDPKSFAGEINKVAFDNLSTKLLGVEEIQNVIYATDRILV